MPISPIDRILARVVQIDRGYRAPVHQTPCWIRDGEARPGVYWYVQDGGVKRGAHVIAYEHYVGPVPEGTELHHLCEQTDCANWQHVVPRTHVENVRIGRASRPSTVRPRLVLRLDDETYEALRERAHETHRPQTAIVVAALKRELGME